MTLLLTKEFKWTKNFLKNLGKKKKNYPYISGWLLKNGLLHK